MKKDWEIKKLGEICEIECGTRVVRKVDGRNIYLLRSHIRNNCICCDDQRQYNDASVQRRILQLYPEFTHAGILSDVRIPVVGL